MRFDSRHPTDVPDEQAELVFLALATKWDGIDTKKLATASVRGSVYVNSLPEAFGARSSTSWSSARIGGTIGVLLHGIEGESFRVHVVDRQGIDLTVVSAPTPTELAQLWDRGDSYGRREDIVIRTAEISYEKRHAESFRDTLRAASPREP